MKYKLIKTYPGSPELNYIAEIQPGTNMYFYNGFQIVEIHKHPEFWQPESEWKIKSKVIESEIGSLHWLNTLLDSYLRMGESLEKMDINPDVLPIWGDVLYRGSMEIMEYFKDKLK